MRLEKQNTTPLHRGRGQGEGPQGSLISGAEAMMRSLENQGVDVLFGYPGGAIMPTYDALYDHKDKLHHMWDVPS